MSQLIGTTFLYVYGDTLELLFWNGWGYLGYGPQSCQQSLPLTCCRFMVRLSCCNTFPSVGVLMFGSSSFLFNLEFRDSFSCFLWRVQVLSENADTYLVTYEGVLALLWGHVEPGYGHMALACMHKHCLFRLLCYGRCCMVYGIPFFFLHVCHDALRYWCLTLRLSYGFWGGIHGSCT